jgi:hypothetical protein
MSSTEVQVGKVGEVAAGARMVPIEELVVVIDGRVGDGVASPAEVAV